MLIRRAHILVQNFNRGAVAARSAAGLIAPVLGWDDEQVQRKVVHDVAQVDAERKSQEWPDDETADAAAGGSGVGPLIGQGA